MDSAGSLTLLVLALAAPSSAWAAGGAGERLAQDLCSQQDAAIRPKLVPGVRDRAPASRICPFTTDGCSRFLDGYSGSPAAWLNCCEIHDIDYWAGFGGREARNRSDEELRACVTHRTNEYLGWVVWSGVTGAAPLNTGRRFPTEYRWGYGWTFVLGDDGRLTREQKRSARQAADTILPAFEGNRRERGLPPLTDDERRGVAEKIRRLREGSD